MIQCACKQKVKSPKPINRLRDVYFHDRFIRQKVGKITQPFLTSIRCICTCIIIYHMLTLDWMEYFSSTVHPGSWRSWGDLANYSLACSSFEIMKLKFIVWPQFGVNAFAIVGRWFGISYIPFYHPFFSLFRVATKVVFIFVWRKRRRKLYSPDSLSPRNAFCMSFTPSTTYQAPRFYCESFSIV